jgi:hypothetical protein
VANSSPFSGEVDATGLALPYDVEEVRSGLVLIRDGSEFDMREMIGSRLRDISRVTARYWARFSELPGRDPSPSHADLASLAPPDPASGTMYGQLRAIALSNAVERLRRLEALDGQSDGSIQS